MRRALVALGIASVGACATAPAGKVVPRATPNRPFSEIVFGERGGSCEIVYKTPSVTVSRSKGQVIFRIVNDCATATGRITFENFQVGGKPVECVRRTSPGPVRAQSERTYPTGVHPSRSAGDRCSFEIHVDGQKADPQIVIIP